MVFTSSALLSRQNQIQPLLGFFFFLLLRQYNYRELKVANGCWYLKIQERDCFTEELIFN